MRFRVVMRSFDTKMENTLLTIKAAATLHNVLSVRQPLSPSAFNREDADGQLLEGEWQQFICWNEGPCRRGGRAVNADGSFQMADFFGTPQAKCHGSGALLEWKDPNVLVTLHLLLTHNLLLTPHLLLLQEYITSSSFLALFRANKHSQEI